MNGLLRKALLWAPWLFLALFGGFALVQVTREASSEDVPLEGGIAIAVGMVLILLMFALAIQAVEQELQRGAMSQRINRLLYWTPRVVALLFAAFLSLFALDVFGEGYTVWETVMALVMHLLPVGVLLVGILIAWRWEWVGALFLAGWAIAYLAMAWGEFFFSVYLLLVILPLAVGVLFLLNWLYRAELHGAAA